MNHHKNDVFCLGLSILELGLLRSVDNVITSDNFLDRGRLKKYISQFKKEYSFNPFLIKVVEYMLEIEPSRRPTFSGEYINLYWKLVNYMEEYKIV